MLQASDAGSQDLQVEGAALLADEYAGKDIALRTMDGMLNELPKLYDVWRPIWDSGPVPTK
ncbi:MAG: hypothetical protein ACE368_09290 [Paracoccaceae bacterium]